ncbi:MAG: LamG domain-containing protein, partial [Clostridia bacterium]|nr:LamG domain-containing protein [Clostridia bacterium]
MAYAADGISGSLVFDLDLSGYDSASSDPAKGIKDAASDSVTEDLTLHSGTVVETFLAGSDIKALKLKRTQQGGIKALDSGVDAVASSNAMTVETWMKVDNSAGNNGSGHALIYTTASEAHNWQLVPAVTTDSKTGITSMSVTNAIHKTTIARHENVTFDEWAHYVFTREYDTTAQTCTLTLYVNGVQTDRQTMMNVSGPQTMSGGILHIGGGTFRNTANYAIDGSMATFKIYSAAMTQAQALAKYNAEKDSYVSQLIGVESVAPAGGTEAEPKEISLEAGQIEINFNNSVKPSDLSKITFTKADNSPANKVNIDFAANNTKKVIVSYGEQEELTNFVLKIDSSLSSTYDKP